MKRFQLTKCAASIRTSCPRCLSFRGRVFRIRGKICSHSRLMGRSNEAVSTNRKSQGEILQLPRCRIIFRAFDGSGLFRGEGWAHFFRRFQNFRILLLILMCAQRSGMRFVFFSLIYRGKFKGDRTSSFIYLFNLYSTRGVMYVSPLLVSYGNSFSRVVF